MLTVSTLLQKYKNLIPLVLTLFGLIGLVLLIAGCAAITRKPHGKDFE